MQKYYIFDLDGTLVDSMSPAVAKVLSLLDEYGIPYESDIVKILTPLGFKGIAKYYAESLGVPLTPTEIFDIFTVRLKAVYTQEVPLKDTALKTLRTLKEEGASLNVLTASPHIFTDGCLKNNGVFDLIDNVWSAEDFGMLKSDKRIYEEAAKRLGVSAEECVFVDDSYHVLCVAKDAGMKTIGVYEAFSRDVTDKIKATADFYAEKLSDILKTKI